MRAQSSRCLSVADDNEQRQELNLQTLLHSESGHWINIPEICLHFIYGRQIVRGGHRGSQSSGTHPRPLLRVVVMFLRLMGVWAPFLSFPYILPSFCGYGLGTS